MNHNTRGIPESHMKENNSKFLMIYYNEEKTVRQKIHPTKYFDNNWKDLAMAVSGSNDDYKSYHSYEVMDTTK